jgi:GTP-binding protein
VNYQLVLTKSRRGRGAELASRLRATQTALSRHPAAHPDLLVTSARNGAGMGELRAAIARLLAERVPV